MLENVKGAIFDMDGTLVDSLFLWEVIWDKFGELFCDGKKIRPSEQDDKAVRTMTLADAMEYIYQRYKIGKRGAELHKAADKIMEEFYAEEVQLKDGVVELLEYLHKRGTKMCIASATDIRLIKIAAKHCDIDKYFDKIFSCAEIGKGKDEPDIYIKAMEYLGTTKEETCVFEDSHIAIKTASLLGVPTVGIYDENNYGQEEIKKIATVYLDKGESFTKLMKRDVKNDKSSKSI